MNTHCLKKSPLKSALLATSAYVLMGMSIPVFAEQEVAQYESKVIKKAVDYVRYHRGTVQPVVVPDGFVEQVVNSIKGFNNYKNLVIEVVGHSDNEPMSAKTQKHFGSNKNLSKLRARRTVELVRQGLIDSGVDVANITFKYVGAGSTQPLVPNDTAEHRQQNRRGEINFYFDQIKPQLVKKTQPISKLPAVAPKAVKVEPASVQKIEKPKQPKVDKVADALAVKADDEDGNSLKETLTSVDKNYSLIKKGKLSFQYGYNFTYSSTEALELSSQANESTGAKYVTDVSRDSRYTHRANISASYGLMDNLTLGASLPVVSTHRSGGVSTDEVSDSNIGDISLSARWQPWETRLGKVNTTIGANLSLPTGVSPYKIDTENTLPTGSGTTSMGLSASFSKVIDPVIAYGGVSVSHALPIDGLSQIRGDQTLVKVEPQPTFSYNMGIGYALSYGVSVNLGLQHSFAAKTKLYFSDDVQKEARGSLLEQELIGGHSAMINTSVGFRTSPGSVVTVSVGAGLTKQSPDFTVGITAPFNFGGFKKYKK